MDVTVIGQYIHSMRDGIDGIVVASASTGGIWAKARQRMQDIGRADSPLHRLALAEGGAREVVIPHLVLTEEPKTAATCRAHAASASVGQAAPALFGNVAWWVLYGRVEVEQRGDRVPVY